MEIFPARLRSTCHGISAAAGKAGALVGAFGFLYAAQSTDPNLVDAGYPTGIGVKNLSELMTSTQPHSAQSMILVGFEQWDHVYPIHIKYMSEYIITSSKLEVLLFSGMVIRHCSSGSRHQLVGDDEPLAFKKMHEFSTVDGFVEITESLGT
ncbi:hypothetical protein RND71_020485 [Anisodus tanguticus]|uniref:Uncharacterized protein n=1 Tax=Anisodus tanguticus TaxID=243964 RepID=A0AAE1S2I0_9SOLA|nr:hypothetical protein RND71_020485 [Anisodus tanguticus]